MSRRTNKQPDQVSNRITLGSLAEHIFASGLQHRSQLPIQGEQIVAGNQTDEMKNEVASILRNYVVAEGIGRTYSYLVIE